MPLEITSTSLSHPAEIGTGNPSLKWARKGAWEQEYGAIQNSPVAKSVYEKTKSRTAAVLALETEADLVSGKIGKEEFTRTAKTIAALAKKLNLPLAGNEGLNTDVRRLVREVLRLSAESETVSLTGAFKRDCVEAGYNVFQLIDFQMRRAGSGIFQTLRPPVFWGSADSFRPINNLIKRATSKSDVVAKRNEELWRMQQVSVPESDPRRYRVGNSVVVLADGKDNRTLLIIYGAISAEVAGSWIGGRTNDNNSVVFELERQNAVDGFLAAIDSSAKAYEDGTERNYRTIVEAMSGVFPKQAMEFTQSHMFHRQEIQEVIDIRGQDLNAPRPKAELPKTYS